MIFAYDLRHWCVPIFEIWQTYFYSNYWKHQKSKTNAKKNNRAYRHNFSISEWITNRSAEYIVKVSLYLQACKNLSWMIRKIGLLFLFWALFRFPPKIFFLSWMYKVFENLFKIHRFTDANGFSLSATESKQK